MNSSGTIASSISLNISSKPAVEFFLGVSVTTPVASFLCTQTSSPGNLHALGKRTA
jgi:hypothetical protein